MGDVQLLFGEGEGTGSSQEHEVALALVREFLSSHGLKKAVKVVDMAKPRTEASITRRSDIARALGIQAWVKENKARANPFPSMLEVIANKVASQRTSGPTPAASSTHRSHKATAGNTYSKASVTESLGIGKLSLDRPSKSRVSARPPPRDDAAFATAADNPLRPPTRRTAGRVGRASASSSDEADSDDNSDNSNDRDTRGQPTVALTTQGTGRNPAPPSSVSLAKRGSRGRRAGGRLATSGLVMEDADDVVVDEAEVTGERTRPTRPSAPRVMAPSSATAAGRGKTITAEEAVRLKRVVFGSSRAGFNEAWLRQNFVFNADVPGLQYGLVQHEGGPCGVLAVVQAVILQELLFNADMPTLDPTPQQQRDALISAITSILLRIQTDGEPVLALVGTKKAAGLKSSFKCDGVTEKLTFISCPSEFDLRRAVRDNIHQFTRPGAPGAILLLYSAVLTRGLASIRGDMDEEASKLIGSHCYCTQDLVNLLLVGYACSNTHDGDKRLGEGKDVLVLKGIRKQSDIGLLSLFEHYGSCEVGVNFKSPSTPIWIIYAESHFTVLFSKAKALTYSTPSGPFDVCYYDQLAGLDRHYEIRIDPTANVPRPDDKEVLPPLEHCIRTKWRGAAVDWCGCEPLY